jgi:hypothetical protein
MGRATLWLALSLALLGAGCGSLGGGSGSPTATETVTPVAVPGTEATPESPLVAPGLADDRVVNDSALAAAHARIVLESPHTYRERVIRRYANGTLQSAYTTVVQRNGTRARYQYNRSASLRNPVPVTVDRWVAANQSYVARTSGNETSYRVADGLGTRIPLRTVDYASSVEQAFRLMEITVTGTDRRGNQTVYRLATPEPQDLPPSRNITFVAHVTPEGVFTDYRLTYDLVRSDEHTRVTVEVAFENIGSTTVPRPDWARNVTNGTPTE